MARSAAFFDTITSRLWLRGWLQATSALRVGEGRSLEPLGTDLPVVRDALGRPYLPGSSFKGSLRSGAEAILRALMGARGACDPLSEKHRCVPSQEVDNLRRRFKDRDEEFTAELYHKTCWACRIFGSPWMQSRVQIQDLEVDPDAWGGQFEIRNGVAIDRETETASEGKLYDFEVVPAGTRFRLRLLVDNASAAELGALMMALRPFEEGEAALGGGRSRGLGGCRLTWEERRYLDLTDRQAALRYFSGEDSGQQVTEATVRGWINAFRSEALKGNGSD